MSSEQPSALESNGDSRLFPALGRMNEWPWWLLFAIFLGLIFTFLILNNETWTIIFLALSEGIKVTLTVAVIGYVVALTVGLFIGLGRVAGTNTLFGVIYYNVATFYVEIIRGIPLLVLLMYVAFVAVPLIVQGLNAVGEWLLGLGLGGLGTTLAELSTRSISNAARATFALGVAYGAFEAEVYRAGIESIEKGQMEAARSLGMSYFQAMRYIILPQAIRRVMPALGNDFVAIVKDSSLVSVLGVQDLTQLAKLYAAGTFLFFQTYSILAFMYLIITISLTRVVRWLERRLRRSRR
jgi:polar amino acid transport system permease protein